MTDPAERDRKRRPETGGADAVNDTPDVAGRGTTPGYTERRSVPRASGTGSRGLPILGWIAIVLALIAFAVYGFGLLSQ